MKEVPFGFYFCREIGQDKVETCLCYGNVPKGKEIIEPIPKIVVKHCEKGVKILNLQKILKNYQK